MESLPDMVETNRIVVIGGVACGPKAAARARRCDPDAEITILEKNSYVSYAGCGAPYYISGIIEEAEDLMKTGIGQVRDADYFEKVKDIKVLTRTEATWIDRTAKIVMAKNLDSGEEFDIPYDKLVLATGAEPIVPRIPGVDLKNVLPLRNLDHGKAISGFIKRRKKNNKIVIVGGGRVGLEVADAFHEKGLDVSIVEMFDNVMDMLLDPEIAAQSQKIIQAAGAKIFTGETVEELSGDKKGNVKKVVTDKREIEADLVIMAVGVRPNVRLAVDAGLETGVTKALKVNANNRTSDPDIFAGGDCVECNHIVTSRPTYAPMGSTANKHGRVIGNNITGSFDTFDGVLGTSIMKLYGVNVGATGLSETVAREQGYDTICSWAPTTDRSHFYPGGESIMIKLIADYKTKKLLGAQVIGPGDIAKPIDVVATALSFNATVDHLAKIDLGYAPPFAQAVAHVSQAANIIRNKIDGFTDSIDPITFSRRLKDSDDDLVLLDVRQEKEIKELPLDDKRLVVIEMGELRRRLKELDSSDEVVTICKVGARAYEVERLLKGKGFRNVKFLDGGIALLASAGLKD